MQSTKNGHDDTRAQTLNEGVPRRIQMPMLQYCNWVRGRAPARDCLKEASRTCWLVGTRVWLKISQVVLPERCGDVNLCANLL